MPSRLNPYLSFRDNAREAMEFYRSVFGGKLDMTTFKEFNASEDPAEGDKIMHGMLEAPNGMVLDLGADTPSTMEHTPGNTMSVSLSGDDEAASAATTTSSRRAAPRRCPWPRRRGATRSGCS